MEKLTTFFNICTDFGFKRMFGSDDNKKLVIRFLNAVFGDNIVITDIQHHDKEILPADEKGKRIIYDIYCTSEIEGYVDPIPVNKKDLDSSKKSRTHHFILEMQNEYEPPFEDRVLYYTSKMIAIQGKKGWNYQLEPVVSIVVTDFDFKRMKKTLIHDMRVSDINTGDVLSDKMRILFLSLNQMKGKEWKDCKTELERILYLIRNMDKLDKKSDAYLSHEYEDFFNAAETAYMAAEDVVTYSESLQRLNAIRAGVDYAFEDGKEEGVQEEKIRTATMMLKRNYPIDDICAITGLSIEEVEHLN